MMNLPPFDTAFAGSKESPALVPIVLPALPSVGYTHGGQQTLSV